MSLEFSEEESRLAVDFLKEFVAERADIGDNDTLPFRLVPFTVDQQELRGDCLEWILEYLQRNNCREDLSAVIAHQAISKLLETDLSSYKIEEENKYDASRLARIVFNTVHQVCRHWCEEPPQIYKSPLSYETSVHAIKNARRKMEDKHVILPHFNRIFGLAKDSPNFAYFAVFDGHGGTDAADYAAAHMHCILAQDPNLLDDPGLALRDTFLNTDSRFGTKAEEEGFRSGCTAVSVLIANDTMYVAWLGDSQVILCKDGEVVELMAPHKPERQDERERIEALGGCVVWFGAWRVNGSLSVSRAIGDFEHKPYISGEPDVSEYTFDGDEEFIILACDGLWDTVKPEEAIQLVRDHIADGKSRNDVAKILVNQAKECGSSDNISVLVIFLDAHRKKVLGNKESTNAQDTLGVPQNGTHNSKSQEVNADANGESRKEGTENSDGIVATVTISTETVIERKTEHLKCKVTCRDDDSELQTRSAGSSPKQSPKTTIKKGTRSVKGSSPKQLDVSKDKNARRNSAPEVLNL